ncbi:CPBP family intramembrane metalloprotease [Pontibacter sp. 172403-2]|uniref:CPBP family intramembrane glutamic endopeptidase n=1 Tax=Pontibacter rufus TaxID=2791028 RepID=UPI0018AFCDA8|nr:type II CAAX endopeptidase family protein [Pontibacter sp. 172403-2]MBF9252422.1 CPBP family intramembrane metalloprotease [Pontibacter sp. 172403-2]
MESISTANPSPVVPSSESALSFRLAKAWGYLGILFLCMVVSAIVVILLAIPFQHGSFNTKSPVMKLLLYVVPFLLFALYLKKKQKLGAMLQPEAGIKRVPGVLYLLILLFIPAIHIALDPLVSLIPMPDVVRDMFVNMSGKDIFTFITIVVAAPVLEEFLMRGLLLRGLLKNYSPATAIIWTSVMFAVLHLNPWQGIGAFVLGLVLGWIYYKTRSIWTCIFLHFANNLMGALMMLILPEELAISSLYDMVGNPLWFGLLYGVALVVLAFCIFSSKRQLSSLPLKYE